MLKLVVAAVMLQVVASKPMDVNVEVTVNGVKIPINFDPQPAGKFKEGEEPSKSGRFNWDEWHKEGKEASKSGRFNWDEWHKEGKEASKSAGYGWIAWLG